MFPKLRLKYKPNLISLAGGMGGLPITNPQSRATPLEPSAWRDMIAQAEVRGPGISLAHSNVVGACLHALMCFDHHIFTLNA